MTSNTLRNTEAGFTLVETSMAMTVVVIGLLSTTSLIFSSVQLEKVNAEEATGTAVAREVIADLQASTIDETWARFNEDTTDDPEGVATAPGKNFTVTRSTSGKGLWDANGRNNNLEMDVTIEFPTDATGQLSEDPTDARFDASLLDLDRDGGRDGGASVEVESVDLLPVMVTVTWESSTGTRTITMPTLLSRNVVGGR